MNEEERISVKKVFTDYLERKNLSRTKERFAILEEVYSFNGHFDVERFYQHMLNKKYKVSRATVYNTIELLLDSNLIMKHQFGKNLALYEKSFASKQHDHLICDDCEHVFEFCDPRIQQIQSMMGDLLKFSITHHSLHLFGKCRELAESGACRNKKSK